MSFNVGGSSGSSQQTSQIDPQFKNQWLQFAGRADDAYRELEQGYKTGTNFLSPSAMVAPMTDAERQGMEMVRGQSTAGLDWLGQAKEGAQDLARGGAFMPVNAGRVAGITSQSAPEMGGLTMPGAAKTSWITSQSAPDLGATTGPAGARVQGAITSQSTPDIGAIGQVNARTLPGSNLNAYMNPYLDAVMERGIKDLETGRRQAVNQTSSDFTLNGGEGAWRGSRAGVADALTNAAYMDKLSDLSTRVRSEGYGQALGALQADNAAQLQADQGNQQLNAQRTMRQADMAFDRGTQNMDAWNRVAFQDADYDQQARMAGAQMSQERDLERYRTQAQYGLANMDAYNRNVEANAEREQAMGTLGAQLGQERDLARYQGESQFRIANQDWANRIATGNADRDLMAQQGNQTAWAQDGALQLDGTRALADIAGRAQEMGLRGGQALMDAGAAQRSIEQQLRDATTQEQLRRQQMLTNAVDTLAKPFGFYPDMGQGGTTKGSSRGKGAGIGIGG